MSIEGAIFCKYPKISEISHGRYRSFANLLTIAPQKVYYFAINKGEMTYEKTQKARI